MLEELFIFDAHCDTLHALYENRSLFKQNKGHLDAMKIQNGGLCAQIFAVYVDPVFSPNQALKRVMLLIQSFHEKVVQSGFCHPVVAERDF